MRWHFSARRLRELAQLQLAILRGVTPALREGDLDFHFRIAQPSRL